MLGRFDLRFPLPLLKSLVLTAFSKVYLICEIAKKNLFGHEIYYEPSPPPASEVPRPHCFLKGHFNPRNE